MKYNPAAKEKLLTFLRTCNISKVVIHYSGSGDSGSVDSVRAYAKGSDDDEDVDVLIAKVHADATLMRITQRLKGEGTDSFNDQLHELAYDILEYAGVEDWVNNDGGEGVITMFVEDGENEDGMPFEAGTIDIQHRTFYTESNHSSFAL